MTSGMCRPAWRDTLAPFAVPCVKRGLFAVATSVLPYVALSVVSYLTLGVSPALTVVLAIVAAGFLVRVFVVFHDWRRFAAAFEARQQRPRHRSRFAGALAFPPVATRPRRTSRDLGRSGQAGSRRHRDADGRRVLGSVAAWSRCLPARAQSVRDVRFRAGVRDDRRSADRGARCPACGCGNSVLGTDAALMILVAGVVLADRLAGFSDRFGAPAALLAGSVGIWLFYVQHQFEDAYWQSGDGLDVRRRRVAGEARI